LLTRTTSSPVTQASLTVRKEDFHPTRRRIVFNDFSAIEISELNYDVSDWNEVTASSLFEPDTASVPVVPSLQKLVEPLPLKPSPAALDEAELRARLALNKANADAGEQIVIRQSQSSIQVTGLVETRKRKQELENSLEGIPLVNTSFQSIEEMSRRPATHPFSKSGVQEYSVAGDSRLQTYLASRAENPEQIAESAHQLLEATLVIQREIRAVDFLNVRFPASDRANLTRDASANLQELLTRHMERLGNAIRSEHTLVDRWITVAAPRSGTKSGPGIGYDDLRLEASKNKELCDELLSTSTEDHGAVDKILAEMQESVQRLEAIMAHLNQTVREDMR
jgi:hypothetical protein